ncbi:tRNA-dihydrouridine synthase [Clostridium sp. SM-530-WT-3G]|uniref:tRNA dihydrouridine synthase n=1 Tax=Clostridium sp. SM-530-WT-3G TaxID=2725303 RepID=UPI00145E7061|nr:tRNA-dihydrouridine synthase [Clostridium sp. SM-530-WT-3G]NME84215.1 tRNA-dihydrouridine synthase [Clostridium sp. SM-530-WT-3G]
MKFYFAPLEGVTGYIYRNAYNSLFGNVDKYFTPFIVPSINKCLKSRELNDILPEHNKGMYVVPQILTNNSEYFLDTVNALREFGYNEINLNLGCPSGTVVGKNRGSGFLALPDELDKFLDEVFSGTDAKISIKTRIGKDSPDEFYKLLDIYNKYPLEELIIHPRIQKDYYKNNPNMKIYKYAEEHSKNSLCYNGDIFNVKDYESLREEYPVLDRVMLGRGIIANPGLIGEIKNKEVVDKEKLKEFHDIIFEGYKEILSGDKNALFKMKEFWFYMKNVFADSDKCAKKIRKTSSVQEYISVVNMIFNELEIEQDSMRGFK